MQGFKTILVPIDFSGLSVPTLETATRLLADGGVAVLLHVVEWLPAVAGGTFGVYPHRKEIEQIKALSKEKLDAYTAERPEIRFETRVAEGKPAAVILETAAEVGPGLIVIGSHGRSGLDHFILGSVTERVLRKSRTAVLVVRAPGHQAE